MPTTTGLKSLGTELALVLASWIDDGGCPELEGMSISVLLSLTHAEEQTWRQARSRLAWLTFAVGPLLSRVVRRLNDNETVLEPLAQVLT